MGVYDREYYRDESERGFFSGGGQFGGRTMITNLILVNVAIFLADQFTSVTPGGGRWLSDQLAATVGSLGRPWEWWKFLTSGFAHDPNDITHIGFNMLMLWMFGRELEALYGPKEFLRMYLVAIVVGAVSWAGIEALQGGPSQLRMYGASGAVSAVTAVYACMYPKRIVLVMFIIPAPIWAVAILTVFVNVSMAINAEDSTIAATAHLAGFAFGFCYWRFGWNFGRIVPDLSRLKRRGQPRLRVHQPDQEPRDTRSFEARVDEVLAKFHRSGEGSLTAEERRLLEEASRRYQERRR